MFIDLFLLLHSQISSKQPHSTQSPSLTLSIVSSLFADSQPMRKFLTTIVWSVILLSSTAHAFEWHSGGRPDVDRRAIAGLWKLSTPQPLKEFTVYPKSSRAPASATNDLLLMLKEDGSFQQYHQEQEDIDASWSTLRRRQSSQAIVDQLHQQLLRGTWEYQDGKLILAADRPEE